MNDDEEIYTDGLHVDALYALNRFYRGLLDLKVETPSERPLLVATTLTKGASSSFQRMALLLSDHTDTLCELTQFGDELDNPSPSIQVRAPKRNRSRKKQRGRK